MREDFDELIEFEIYRRHIPTVFVFNASSHEYFLSFQRFDPNFIDIPLFCKQSHEFLKDVLQGNISKLKKGFLYLYLKFINLQYIYNFFHIMFNYFVGLFSCIFILFVWIFEKKLLGKKKATQAKEKTNSKETESPEKDPSKQKIE